jgi:hypothetical protein
MTSLKAFVASMLLTLGCAASASAETLTWHVRSNYPYTVELKFYSATRNHVWPNNYEVWLLNDYLIHTFSLTCRRGEKICYGAWPRGNTRYYWGVGQNNQSCADCCYTCNGDETIIRDLN